MSFPFYSVPICFGITMAPRFMKAASLPFQNSNTAGRVDISSMPLPKDELARLKRLEAAHQNGFEALGFYAAGVAAAVSAGVPVAELTTLCQVHVAARAVYVAVYAAPPVAGGFLRSLVWAVGTGATVMLWVTAGRYYQA